MIRVGVAVALAAAVVVVVAVAAEVVLHFCPANALRPEGGINKDDPSFKNMVKRNIRVARPSMP